MVQRVLKANFNTAWEEIGANNELENTFSLPINNLEGKILNFRYINILKTKLYSIKINIM